MLLSSRVVGYFPEYRWSFFNKIDWDAVTHINYFSLLANSNGSLSTANINLAHLDTLVATAHSHGDTISITVGPHSFSTLAGNPTATSNFVNNIVQFCNAHDLDGVDIDWEEPNGPPTNIALYGSLIDALHAQTASNGLKLTIAAYPTTHHIPVSSIPKLDWINVMAYNFSYADHTNYTQSTNSLIGWNNYGVPREKLLLGIPFYGRKGTSWSNTFTEIYDTIIDNYFNANGFYPSPDADLVDGWYINGVNTVRDKSVYVRDNDYGGVMIWELGQDHLNIFGDLDEMSLLPVIKSVLVDVTPPAVSSSDFVFTTAPHKLQFQFSENVGASLQPADLTVRDINTQASIIVTDVSFDGATNRATFTLNGIVPDGNYRATLSGTGITDPAGNPLGNDHIYDFFFLNGDANHDGTVNLNDFNIVAANFGQSGRDFTQGDFNYDTVVNLLDFNILAARFGVSLGPQGSITARPGWRPAPFGESIIRPEPDEDALTALLS